jgi:hypothetical protein
MWRIGIAHQIMTERQRQEQLKAAGKFLYTCADTEMNDSQCLVVLAEEFGEVAREVCDGMHVYADKTNLRGELVQTAAVCMAWIEKIDSENAEIERANLALAEFQAASSKTA